jgi:hypothetical protein
LNLELDAREAKCKEEVSKERDLIRQEYDRLTKLQD